MRSFFKTQREGLDKLKLKEMDKLNVQGEILVLNNSSSNLSFLIHFYQLRCLGTSKPNQQLHVTNLKSNSIVAE